MKEYNLKKVLGQLNQWCATNNISVQSVYDECHGMTLQEIVYYLLGVVKEAVNQVIENTDAFQELYNFVHDYFDNLDVQEEINNKLDEMYNNGQLESLITGNFKLGNALYIGNSYTQGAGSSTQDMGLYNLTKDKLFYQSYVQTGGGRGFSPYANHDLTFSDLLDTAYEALSETERSSITHVIFISAMGDNRFLASESVEDEISNIKNCINKIKTQFPNARGYILLAEAFTVDNIDGLNCSLQSSYNADYCFKIACRETDNCSYLGYIGWDITHATGYNASDGYHPNDSGYSVLAYNFVKAFTTGFTPSVRQSVANIAGGNWVIKSDFYNTDIYPYSGDGSVTLQANEQTELFNFSTFNGIYPCGSLLRWDASIRLSAETLGFGIFTIVQKVLYIRPNIGGSISSHWVFGFFGNVNGASLNEF